MRFLEEVNDWKEAPPTIRCHSQLCTHDLRRVVTLLQLHKTCFKILTTDAVKLDL